MALETKEELRLGEIIYRYKHPKKGEDKVSASEAKAAHDELFEHNKDLAYKIANTLWLKTNCKHYEKADLFQDALMALSKAIWKYDYRKGVRITTYAYYWIYQESSRMINRMRPVYIPVKDQEAWARISKARQKYDSLENKEEISEIDFICKKAKVSEQELVDLEAAINGTVSCDNLINDEGHSFVDSFQHDPYDEVLDKHNLNDKTLAILSLCQTVFEKDIIMSELGLETANLLERYDLSERQLTVHRKELLLALKERATEELATFA